MYTRREYDHLLSRYGSYSSWAIWDDSDAHDTSIIDENIHELNPSFIFVGLNISRILSKPAWSNFHDNTHSRKLRYACNYTKLRGAYLTDLFKDLPEAKSSNLIKTLTENQIEDNVNFFLNEMGDIKLKSESQFIILGSAAAKYFDKYFKKHFANNVLYYDHYSAYNKYTDKEWVVGLWEKLNIKDGVASIFNNSSGIR